MKAGHAEREGKTVSSRGNKAGTVSGLLERDSLTACVQGEHSGLGDTDHVQPTV